MPATLSVSGSAAARTERIDSCMICDRHKLRRALAGQRDAAAQAKLDAQIERSLQRAETRRQKLPQLPSAPDLPISARRDDILAALDRHQVIIVCGETGSGKTTQLPQLCLAAGRGVFGLIGHTQPRRLAARSVAARISQELQSPPGQAVGYKVRFNDHTSPDSYIKLMTDGVLLAETQTDRSLSQYDTLIIDEAHERSLNIDFLLGYLKQLLPRRPDLKVIITSATINTDLFSRHFSNAPVIEVSGRTYPVDTLWRPLAADEGEEASPDLDAAIADAIDEITRLRPDGNILVFLPGEREIRDCAEALSGRYPPPTEILPLFARLSAADQARIFDRSNGRKIILSTNVAETSLTVPGIVGVVDPGLARINRYSFRSKVERLQTEKISQASARQRAGRCGRIAPGTCIRLYAEEDYDNRPAFTDPEIRRSNLAAVILRMLALGLGDIDAFPFVEAPDARMVQDGFRLLFELGALDDRRRLTDIGRQLGRLPVDPRVGRMLVAACQEGCLTEVLIIAAGLSVQDPRERPVDRQEAADTAHRAFQVEHSDFLGLLKIWQFFDAAVATGLSNRRLHQHCRQHFLSLTRLREWRDVLTQLRQLAEEMGLRANTQPATADAIHRALLAGLLGSIGNRTEAGDYLAPRGSRFHIHPGSTLHRKGPAWIMASELVETTRLYGRMAAKIEPGWAEALAGSLCQRHYDDPHWEKRQAQVMAFERVTLFGLTLVARRRVPYGRINPIEAREIFIREGLVAGEYLTRAPFLAHNLKLIEELEELEHRARRRDLLVDDATQFAFYDRLLPADAVNGAAFEHWRKQAERDHPRLLFMTRDDLLRRDTDAITAERFPQQIELSGAGLPLSYLFEPGRQRDGVTLTVPLPALNQVDAAKADWLVPGLLGEKVEALLRGLPQSLRRSFVPVPETARRVTEKLAFDGRPLTEALGEALFRLTGVQVPADAWNRRGLPAHLHMNYRITDADGKELAQGRDLQALRESLGVTEGQQLPAEAAAGFEREALAAWDFGNLPDSLPYTLRGARLTGFPALQDEDGRVALRIFDAGQTAARAHPAGVRRLLLQLAAEQVKFLRRQSPVTPQMALAFAPSGNIEALREDLLLAAAGRIMNGEAPRQQAAFEALAGKVRAQLVATANETGSLLAAILAAWQEVRLHLERAAPALKPTMEDIRGQMERLVAPGFLSTVPPQRLIHFPRYLKALTLRLQKASSGGLARDRQLAGELNSLRAEFDTVTARPARNAEMAQRREEYRWMLEELAVSFFAQELKTPAPVSARRLQKFRETFD